MWFKNAQIFRVLSDLAYDPEALENELKAFAFTDCLPTFSESYGWFNPMGQEGGPLVYAANGYLMICLQFEEKVLPASVVKHELDLKVKEIQDKEERKVGRNEKRDLKDALIYKLRPRAFSRFTKIHAFFDTAGQRLILDSVSASKTEKFIAMLKKSLPNMMVTIPDVKKPRYEMTQWVQNDNTPGELLIQKSCTLQDPQDQQRVIRCQKQNLFSKHIQGLLKEGCEVKQLSLSWNDQIEFALAEDFTLRGLRFGTELLAAAKDDMTETDAQQFDADFVLMTEALSGLVEELMSHFLKTNQPAPKTEAAAEPV